MLSLSTTSTFEYPYLDTMRGNTKEMCFGGQGRCIILAAKTDCDRPSIEFRCCGMHGFKITQNNSSCDFDVSHWILLSFLHMSTSVTVKTRWFPVKKGN